MLSFTHLAARVGAAAVLLAPLGFATPSIAASTRAVPVAAKAKSAMGDDVETRIKNLHKQLHITAAQEAAWNDVAQVMRESATAMKELRTKAADDKSMTAVDQLKSYASIIDTHADGVHKLVPAFQKLYDTMSDEQKKTADAVFRERARAEAQRHKS
jgi:parvulin-like peptidyl-prolyl isomerase